MKQAIGMVIDLEGVLINYMRFKPIYYQREREPHKVKTIHKYTIRSFRAISTFFLRKYISKLKRIFYVVIPFYRQNYTKH